MRNVSNSPFLDSSTTKYTNGSHASSTHMSKQQKYAKVDTTIKELDLERCVLNHILICAPSSVHVRIKHKLLRMKGIKKCFLK